jgi:hypothetical protein
MDGSVDYSYTRQASTRGTVGELLSRLLYMPEFPCGLVLFGFLVLVYAPYLYLIRR